jgi:zona occludens toxin
MGFGVDGEIIEKATDEQLIEIAKQFNYYKASFFIDEAQNYLSKKQDHIMWFWTYHRHLNIDIYCITQNISYIHTDYKKNIEEFVRAVPSKFRINANTLR